MGIVADFNESNDMGWNITKEEFLVKALEELPQYPHVAIVITGETTALINRNYVRVRLINPDDNGNPSGSAE